MLTYKREQVLIDTLASYKDLPHLNKVRFRLLFLAVFLNAHIELSLTVLIW